MSALNALIVAGGVGKRMGTQTPKQFLEVDGLPILMRTIRAFFQFDNSINILLTLPGAHIESWRGLVEKHEFQIAHSIVEGGETRFRSVKNGLSQLESDGLVAIHDGVRPFVSTRMISDSFNIAEKTGSAIAAVALKESIRKVSGGSSKSLDRSNYRLIQTPQTFSLNKIKQAYQTAELPIFTDDASVFEYSIGEITLYEGEYTNIKITTNEDLAFAESICRSSKPTNM